MEEQKERFLNALLSKSPDIIASLWIIDRIPVIFSNNQEAYINWKHTLAKQLDVDPSSLVITGSSAFGVSLNPYKNYKAFDEKSDIDVAIISEHHFNIGWRTLRGLGPKIHSLTPDTKQAVLNHVDTYIYWGTIATDKILHLMPFGKNWRKGLDQMKSVPPTNGRVIKARIYKDFDSLRSYQINNLKNLRTQELEKAI